MRKSAMAAIVVATIVSLWFFVMLNRVFPGTTREIGTLLATIHAVVFAGLWGLIYLGIADLQPRDLTRTAEGLAQQTITKLFRWDRTLRAMLLMAIIHLPFLMTALLIVFLERPFSQAQLFIVPGAWIAAFTGGFILGTEEDEAPYWTVEIAQIVLNLGCFALLVFADLVGWSEVALGGAFKVFFVRILTFAVLCALGAWIGTRRRDGDALQGA